jgi:hypothetical protein
MPVYIPTTGGGNIIETDAALRAAIIAAGNGPATITLRSGTIFREFIWPSTRQGTGSGQNYQPLPLSSMLKITSSDPNEPAILRGVLLTGEKTAQFIGLSGTSPNRVERVWFDYVTFYGERFDTFFTNPKFNVQGSGTIQTVASGGSGYSIQVAGVILPEGHWRRGNDGYHLSWSVHGNYSNATYGMVGLNVHDGGDNIRVTNCEFNGYAHPIDGGGSNLHVANCWFNQTCVDMFKLNNCSGLTAEWNLISNYRTITPLQTAWLFPLGEDHSPTDIPKNPHADIFQHGGSLTGFTARYNYMNDSSGEVHFALLNKGGGNILITNNESRQSHNTGWIVTDMNGITFTKNKSTSTDASKVIFQMGSADKANSGTRVYEDNMAESFVREIRPDTTTSPNARNQVSTEPTEYPAGFVQVRKGATGSGRYAGIGGNPTNTWDPSR